MQCNLVQCMWCSVCDVIHVVQCSVAVQCGVVYVGVCNVVQCMWNSVWLCSVFGAIKSGAA